MEAFPTIDSVLLMLYYSYGKKPIMGCVLNIKLSNCGGITNMCILDEEPWNHCKPEANRIWQKSKKEKKREKQTRSKYWIIMPPVGFGSIFMMLKPNWVNIWKKFTSDIFRFGGSFSFVVMVFWFSKGFVLWDRNLFFFPPIQTQLFHRLKTTRLSCMYVVVSLSVRTFLPDNFVSLIINTRVSTYLRNVKQTQKSAVGTAIEINVEQPRLENKRNGERQR